MKFFNTYLRSTLNTSHVRTAYNVLNQYRQLAEAVLAQAGSIEAGRRDRRSTFTYYGQIAHGMDLGFVTETVAYDLATLCEHAFTSRARRRTTQC